MGFGNTIVNKKICGALLMLVALSACESQTFYDLFGTHRTTPEGSNVDFNNRHAPALNNVTNNNAPDTPPDVYSPQASTRRVPIENTAGADSGSPSLADIPPVPTHTPKDQSTAEFRALAGDHDASEAGRKQLMSDSSATVMTSPQTGQLVNNPDAATMPQMQPATPAYVATSAPAPNPVPAPAPQQAKDDGGFNSWLHNLLPSDNTSNAAPANAPVEAKQTPAENPTPAQAPHELMATAPAPTPAPMPYASFSPSVPDEALANAPMEPIHLHPPTASPSEEVAAEPVHLHPPAASSFNDLAQSSGADMAAEPVMLTPPAADSQTHYLAESRYAARRMYVPADDNSNNY